MTTHVPPTTRSTLLLRLCEQGDRAAWDEFIQVYGSLVHQEVCRRGIAQTDADDVTQIVFLRLLKALPSFRYDPSRGRFRDWLGTVIRFEVSRYRRDHGRPREQATSPEKLDDVVMIETDAEWSNAFQMRVLEESLKRSRSRFDELTWNAFIEVWVRNRPPAEVAKAFDRTLAWVYIAKSRGLKVLAENLDELMGQFPCSPDSTDD
jgi:RNA polymerase sigma factor (sigma-70 family)